MPLVDAATPARNQVRTAPSPAVIELDEATRRYGSTWALDGLTLEVPRGEVHALAGPNGAGKTTALRLLATLEAPTAGAARVDGHDAADEPRQVRRRIGYLGHRTPVHDALTPHEHLGFDADARSADQDAVDDLLEALDLPVSRPAAELSRGTRRRLGLARALVGDPPALLLDEPLSPLDPAARDEAAALLTGLDDSRAVLLATHDLEAAATLSDQVHVLREGRLAGSVPADDPDEARHRARDLLEADP